MKIQSGKPTDRNASAGVKDGEASSAVEDLFALLFANMVTGQQINLQTPEQKPAQSMENPQEDTVASKQTMISPALNNQAMLNMLTAYNAEKEKSENINADNDVADNTKNEISSFVPSQVAPEDTQSKVQIPANPKPVTANKETKNVAKNQLDNLLGSKPSIDSTKNNSQQTDDKVVFQNVANTVKDKLNMTEPGNNAVSNQYAATITVKNQDIDTTLIQPKLKPEMQDKQYLSHNPVEPVIQLELTRNEVSNLNNKSNFEYNLSIKVHPADLGEVTAKIEINQNNSVLYLTAENSHVKEIMLANIDQLKSELSNSGIQINHVHVNINENSGSQQNMQQSQQQQTVQDDDIQKSPIKTATKEDKKSNNDLLIDTYA